MDSQDILWSRFCRVDPVMPKSSSAAPPTPDPTPGVTELLAAYKQGDRAALDRMFPVVYTELRRLAGYHLNRERRNHTLQATALVHEAYVLLIQQREVDWENHSQ